MEPDKKVVLKANKILISSFFLMMFGITSTCYGSLSLLDKNQGLLPINLCCLIPGLATIALGTMLFIGGTVLENKTRK